MTPFIGQIILFAGNYAPRDWAFCDGQLLEIASYPALYSILGTTYGGDGVTTFALPDLRGRGPIHAGTGPGLMPRRLGDKGGTATVALTQSQMPSHTHAFNASDDLQVDVTIEASAGNAGTTEPGGALLSRTGAEIYAEEADRRVAMSSQMAQVSVSGGSGTNANTGGGQSHNNMQPFLVLNHIIALEGEFPPRN